MVYPFEQLTVKHMTHTEEYFVSFHPILYHLSLEIIWLFMGLLDCVSSSRRLRHHHQSWFVVNQTNVPWNHKRVLPSKSRLYEIKGEK
mmetsp:Transcript_36746/g.58906  ORF Transcript_36746/g.58906 Transcript_36746/m.58906 type:complete len:88 (-) Transcript_36746:206-469(-)